MTAAGQLTPASAEAAPEDPTARALRAERDFLLRSLADLEAEREVGDISEQRYRDLHDRYTVQAANVIRALARVEAEAAPLAKPRPRGPERVVAAVAAVAVVAVGGITLLGATRDRGAGETITGNAQSGSSPGEALARAAAERPDDVNAQLAHASSLMQRGDYLESLKTFDAAARLAPDNPMPQAYAGWLLFLAGLPEEAMKRLDQAVTTDPDFADTHFFRGMVLLRSRQDRAGALRSLREYMRLAPPGPERARVEQMVRELEAER